MSWVENIWPFCFTQILSIDQIVRTYLVQFCSGEVTLPLISVHVAVFICYNLYCSRFSASLKLPTGISKYSLFHWSWQECWIQPEENQPQNMIVLPPCFTVGMLFFWKVLYSFVLIWPFRMFNWYSDHKMFSLILLLYKTISIWNTKI